MVPEHGLGGRGNASRQAGQGDVLRREAVVRGLRKVVVVGALVGMRVTEVPGLRGRGVVHDGGVRQQAAELPVAEPQPSGSLHSIEVWKFQRGASSRNSPQNTALRAS